MKLDIETLLNRLEKTSLISVANKIDEKQRAEIFVLKYLFKNMDKDITAGEITEQYGVTTARTATIIKQLEEKNLIIRKKSNIDARIHIISLTDYGIKVIREKKLKSEELITNVIENIGIEEFENFVSTIEKINEYLKNININE